MIIPLFLVLIWGFCASAYTERPEITDPPLKLQFTPTNPRQTAPTSTVWGAIVTSYLNVSFRECEDTIVWLTFAGGRLRPCHGGEH